MDPTRAFVKNVKRMVVKVGTAVVTRSDGRLALGRIGALCEQLKELNSQEYEVILVTSGAVGLGRQRLRYRRLANTSFADLQYLDGVLDDGKACASVGQGSLMALYDIMFSQLDVTSSQLLVTDGVFRQNELRKTLYDTVYSLLDMRVIPIFNENDAISPRREPLMDSSGIFWDNDSLACLLAKELKADLLVMLSDVEGLYSGPPSDPKSKLIHTYVKEKHQNEVTFDDNSRVGRGGMTAKVNAAVSAANAGIPVIITSGYATDNIIKVLQGKRVGTVFHQDADLWPLVIEVCAREMAAAAGECCARLQALKSEERSKILIDIADALEAKESLIIAENEADIAAALEAGCDEASVSRWSLNPGKITSLAKSIRKLAGMEDPLGHVLQRKELGDGVFSEKVACPMGVILVVSESAPDELVHISSLAIKAGNGLLLKGETEAKRTNAVLHKIIASAIPSVVGDELIGFVTSEEEIQDLLKLEDVVDLVISRGKSKLVSQIKESTNIPVLVPNVVTCHAVMDNSADMSMVRTILYDTKKAHLNDTGAINKVLVYKILAHKDLSSNSGFTELLAEVQREGVSVYGGPEASALLNIPEASTFHLEYNTETWMIEIFEDFVSASNLFRQYKSDCCMITSDSDMAEEFLTNVNGEELSQNGSTIYSNGSHSEVDAKVGITLNWIQARDHPIGVEGMLTTRWILRGDKKTVDGFKGIKKLVEKLSL